jgi:hypothetical protein
MSSSALLQLETACSPDGVSLGLDWIPAPPKFGPVPVEPRRLQRVLGNARLTGVLENAKLSGVLEDTRLSSVVPASRLQVRPAPATVMSGIAAVDALTGGLPRGALTEICGPASSGRTSLVLAALAQVTRRQEVCAVVDTSDAFDPLSAAAAGVDLKRLLWVRCGCEPRDADRPSQQRNILRFGTRGQPPGGNATLARDHARERSRYNVTGKTLATAQRDIISNPIINPIRDTISTPISNRIRYSGSNVEQALKATDLLLQSGGFGMVVVDLADIPPQTARRVPLTSWFRFRRAVENTPTVLLVIEQQPYAKTCASLVLELQPAALDHEPSGKHLPAHARLLRGMEIRAEVVRSAQQRKPARATGSKFQVQAQWA